MIYASRSNCAVRLKWHSGIQTQPDAIIAAMLHHSSGFLDFSRLLRLCQFLKMGIPEGLNQQRCCILLHNNKKTV